MYHMCESYHNLKNRCQPEGRCRGASDDRCLVHEFLVLVDPDSYFKTLSQASTAPGEEPQSHISFFAMSKSLKSKTEKKKKEYCAVRHNILMQFTKYYIEKQYLPCYPERKQSKEIDIPAFRMLSK